MTNTLVIDTSYGSTVGIVGYEPIVETDSRTHVERLQTNIATVVREAGLKPTDLERIVVGVGPAPFTGLRAGVVTAKALAYATGAKLLGQDILAPQARIARMAMQGNKDTRSIGFLSDLQDAQGDSAHLILAVNDARRRQLYFSVFEDGSKEEGAGPLLAMDIDYPEHIVELIDACAEKISRESGRPCTVDIIGHGAGKYATAWKKLTYPGRVIDSSVLDTGAAGLRVFAQCALERHADEGRTQNGDGVEPLYLRRPDVSVPRPLKQVLNHGSATRG